MLLLMMMMMMMMLRLRCRRDDVVSNGPSFLPHAPRWLQYDCWAIMHGINKQQLQQQQQQQPLAS